MELQSAIDIINDQLVFLPGWEITAEPMVNRFENTVRLHVNYPATRTERELMRSGDVEPIATRASFPLVCDFPDIVGLARCILMDVIAPINMHEAREGLRFKPTFWAPFHPHRVDGMQRWGNVPGDLLFGVA